MSTNLETTSYLEKARAALAENDEINAESYYRMALSTDNHCDEALWFAATFKMLNDARAGVFDQVEGCYDVIDVHFSFVLEEISDMETRKKVAKLMLNTLAGATEAAVKKYIDSHHAMTAYQSIAKNLVKCLGDSPETTELVVPVWKEIVFLRHSYCVYRNAQDKNKETWYDVMIKDIKKYDPSYQAPVFTQAGCIMVGDKAIEASRVNPGE